MIYQNFGNAEYTVKGWLLTTSVPALLERTPGVYSVFLAMPKGSPVPSLVLSRVSGGPNARKDLPQATTRIQFDCWGKSRDQADLIYRTLVDELESLPLYGGYVDPDTGTYIGSASVQSIRWLPDPNSDTPRYIVDALITTVA